MWFEKVINFIVENQIVLIGLLFFISEALALIPAVKSNSVAQWIFNVVKSIYDKVNKPKV